MAWAPDSDVTAAAIATNLQILVILGTDGATSAKNLVNDTAYTVTEAGGTYGTDSIGSYYEPTGSGQELNLNIAAESPVVGSPFSFFITFSRRNTVPDWAPLFGLFNSGGDWVQALQRVGGDPSMRVWRNNSSATEIAYNLATGPALDTEHTLVVTSNGTTTKLFFTGGGAAVSVAQTALATATLTAMTLGGWPSGEYYPARFRAFGRWTRALTDSEAQAFANDPQQIMAAAVPDAPTAGTASSVTATTATLPWLDNSDDETGFDVQIAASPFSSWSTVSGSPAAINATSIAVTGLTASTQYQFRVRAKGASGDSAWSTSATFTTSAPAIPTMPTAGGATTVAARTAVANWTDNSSNEDGFDVETAPGPDFNVWTSQGTAAANATSRALTGLTPDTDYRFRVRGSGADGDSSWDVSATFHTRTLQKARPISDVSAGPWTPSTGSALYAMLDELAADDFDFVQATAAGAFRVRMGALADPGMDADLQLAVRGKGDGSIAFTASLVQPGTPDITIGSVVWTPGVTASTNVLTFNSTQIANITTWGVLDVIVSRA
ncbi:MAG TPA: fibronectin type III domain-containing protein [Burkholderiaceae bacterium]|nr:fibronectin type III domain-containing protein [Burkholderiaceae bacterium]